MKREIMLRAFELQNWLSICESGGVEPERIPKSCSYTEEEDGSASLEIHYVFPETVSPCSDVIYHVIEPYKDRVATYHLTKDMVLSQPGGNLFGNFLMDYKPEVEEFCRKYGVSY